MNVLVSGTKCRPQLHLSQGLSIGTDLSHQHELQVFMSRWFLGTRSWMLIVPRDKGHREGHGMKPSQLLARRQHPAECEPRVSLLD